MGICAIGFAFLNLRCRADNGDDVFEFRHEDIIQIVFLYGIINHLISIFLIALFGLFSLCACTMTIIEKSNKLPLVLLEQSAIITIPKLSDLFVFAFGQVGLHERG